VIAVNRIFSLLTSGKTPAALIAFALLNSGSAVYADAQVDTILANRPAEENSLGSTEPTPPLDSKPESPTPSEKVKPSPVKKTAAPFGNINVIAKVGDKPITQLDLDYRIKFVMNTSGMQDTPETRANLKDRVLKKMIDEQLQIAEAEARGIVTTQEDVLKGIRTIEQREGMAAGALLKVATEMNIPTYIVEDQVKASMVWSDVVSQSVQGQSLVSDPEIDAFIKRMQDHASLGQITVSEIFIPTDTPSGQEKARTDTLKILEQVRRPGAVFGEIARNLSKSASAAQGGFIGPMVKGVFEPTAETAILALKDGEISEPVLIQGGYALYMRNPSDRTEYTVLQLTIPFKTDGEAHAAADYIQDLTSKTLSCTDRMAQLKREMPHAQVALNEHVSPARLNPQLVKILNSQKREQMSGPINAGSAMLSMALCKVGAVEVKIPTRDEVRDILSNQKVGLIATRLMRDLRRTKVINNE
jgi:peptidyl-prolyl cis-trans isomerase SurA